MSWRRLRLCDHFQTSNCLLNQAKKKTNQITMIQNHSRPKKLIDQWNKPSIFKNWNILLEAERLIRTLLEDKVPVRNLQLIFSAKWSHGSLKNRKRFWLKIIGWQVLLVAESEVQITKVGGDIVDIRARIKNSFRVIKALIGILRIKRSNIEFRFWKIMWLSLRKSTSKTVI